MTHVFAALIAAALIAVTAGPRFVTAQAPAPGAPATAAAGAKPSRTSDG